MAKHLPIEITVKEAAKMLGISDRRVRYMIDEKKLKARKLGEGNLPYLVDKQSVLEVIASQEKERSQSSN